MAASQLIEVTVAATKTAFSTSSYAPPRFDHQLAYSLPVLAEIDGQVVYVNVLSTQTSFVVRKTVATRGAPPDRQRCLRRLSAST